MESSLFSRDRTERMSLSVLYVKYAFKKTIMKFISYKYRECLHKVHAGVLQNTET